MSKQFMITSPLLEGHLFFEYNQAGVIQQFVNSTTKPLSDTQLSWLCANFPTTLAALEYIAGTSKTMKITQVVANYDFETIWDAYGYKVGNKTRAKTLWEKLSRDDQMKVFDSLPGYSYYLQIKDKMERCYLETYLAQRRFEADYKTLAKSIKA